MGAYSTESRGGRRSGSQEDTTFRVPRTSRLTRRTQPTMEVTSFKVDEVGEFFRIARQFPLLDVNTQLPLVLKAYAEEKEQMQLSKKPEITAFEALRRDPQFQTAITKDYELFDNLFQMSSSVEQVLLLSNLRLVAYIANIWEKDHLSYIDRIHAGIPGLIEGIRTVKPEKGKFSAHVTQRIKNHITDATVETGYSVPIPKNLMWDIRLVERLMYDFEVSHGGRSPSREEIINLFEASAKADIEQKENPEKEKRKRRLRAKNALEVLESKIMTGVSLSSPTLIEDLAEFEFADSTQNTEIDGVRATEIAQIRKALSQLSPEEAEILALHYGKDELSYTQIAEKLGTTRRRVDALQKKAHKKLKALLADLQ